MAKKQKEWARRRRRFWIEILGGHCAVCGTDCSLTFDCIIPQGDRHHRMDTSARMCFYHAQIKKGNIQLLCDECQTKKSQREARENFLPLNNEPF